MLAMINKAQDEATLATRTQTAMNLDEPIKLRGNTQIETNETSRLQAPVALELAERRIPEENPRCSQAGNECYDCLAQRQPFETGCSSHYSKSTTEQDGLFLSLALWIPTASGSVSSACH